MYIINMKYLCIIVDRETKKEITSYEIDAKDWYYARHQARLQYSFQNPN